jgi:hypothetical protein
MKLMTMTMLLLCSIGCVQIDRVHAEAPKPKGGCWSRDVAMRPTADLPTTTTVKGRIIAIEHNDQDRQIAAKDLVTWVQVQTDPGVSQSIYLGSDRHLQQQRLQLKIQDLVEITGVQVIKPKQLPTIVASSIKKGDRTWKFEKVGTKPTMAVWCKHNG